MAVPSDKNTSVKVVESLSTAFSLPSQIETVTLLISVNGVHNCSA